MKQLQSEIAYGELFMHLPVAVIVARNRIMVECNERALELFRAGREDIVDQSFAVLYPEEKDFESAGKRIEPLLARQVVFTDDRIMRRVDGTHFWVTVRGYAFNREDPYELAAWAFVDFSPSDRDNQVAASLTKRERDVAALVIGGGTSKEIGRELGISPRTVDIHRASLLKKYGVNTTADLIKRLID